MSDAGLEELWHEYLRAERDRIRGVMMPALDRFIDRLLQEPAPVWQAWAKDLAASVSDWGADTPVRFPLFRRLLLPALAEGVLRGEPGCARWLASFESLLVNSPDNGLPAELQTEVGLLTAAVRLDPADDRARRRLIERHVWYLEYTLHELPSGVLYGNHGATAEECDELLKLLEEFRQHLAITSQEKRFAELVQECELHFRAFSDYRRTGPLPGGYEEYLEHMKAATATRPLHIGIVACTAEGAALCYRTICAEGAALLGAHAHPEVSLHSASLSDYVRCLEEGDLQGVADLMLASARKLAAAGADFLICPDNTIHQAFGLVAPASPLPWLHIAEVVASEAEARGHHRPGLLGTHWLVSSEVYPERLASRGLECIRPGDAERDEIGRLIMEELVYGIFRPETVTYFQEVISGLQRRGCDAVILGCTEIPLIITDRNSPLPTLDSTRLLARAALRRAVAAR